MPVTGTQPGGQGRHATSQTCDIVGDYVDSPPCTSSDVQEIINFYATEDEQLCKSLHHVVASAFASSDPGTKLFSISEEARYQRWRIIMRNFTLRNPTRRCLYSSPDQQAVAVMYHYPAERDDQLPNAPGASREQLTALTRPQLAQAAAELVADLEATEARLHEELGPYFYLAFLAVLPGTQGKGVGTGLLAHLLARCDALRLPCVLAASSESARRLYLRHGFCQVAARRWSHPDFEGSAQLYWMVRGAAGQEVREGLLGAGAS